MTNNKKILKALFEAGADSELTDAYGWKAIYFHFSLNPDFSKLEKQLKKIFVVDKEMGND